MGGGGSIAQLLAFLLLDPATPDLICSVPEIFSDEQIIDIAKVNKRSWFVESREFLGNVEQTHVVTASGKPVP